jgi:hypothetical protein
MSVRVISAVRVALFLVAVGPSCGGSVVVRSEAGALDGTNGDGSGPPAPADGGSGDEAAVAASPVLPAVGWYNLKSDAGIACTRGADCPAASPRCCATSTTTTACQAAPCDGAQLCTSDTECVSPTPVCGAIPAAPNSPVAICGKGPQPVDLCSETCTGCCAEYRTCSDLGHDDTACGAGGIRCVDCTVIGAVCDSHRLCAASLTGQ